MHFIFDRTWNYDELHIFEVQTKYTQMYTKIVKDHMYSRSNDEKKVKFNLQYSKLVSGKNRLWEFS